MNDPFLNNPILVTGASGLLGKAVCEILDRKKFSYVKSTHRKEAVSGHTVYMDLKSGDGIKEAIKSKSVVLHLASDKKHPDNDVNGTALLVQEIKNQRPKVHFIYISIVGTDLLPMTYFKQKYQIEKIIENSGIHWSILRTTQFFEYIDQVLNQFLQFPIGFIPKLVPVQPIDKALVAEELAEMIFKPPSYQIKNIGGKNISTLEETARHWLNKYQKKRMIFNLPLWGKLGRNLLAGALTTEHIHHIY
jgi:uncharacterized protein YbjT (DUF2867 family)